MNTNFKFFKKFKSLPVDQFYNNVLYDKNIGYYNSVTPFGKRGDFITAPNISNIFSEMIAIASYRYKRFILYGKLNFAQVDNAIHKSTIQTTEGNIGYVMNPVTNLMVNAGVRMRQQENAPSTQWVYFGIKTNLRNLYYDY